MVVSLTLADTMKQTCALFFFNITKKLGNFYFNLLIVLNRIVMLRDDTHYHGHVSQSFLL